jgi:hypothetical protein
MALPVCGLRPCLAFLFTTEKVPKPTSPSFPVFLSSFATAPRNASSALEAAALVMSASCAITPINSAFVIVQSPFQKLNIQPPPAAVNCLRPACQAGFLPVFGHTCVFVQRGSIRFKTAVRLTQKKITSKKKVNDTSRRCWQTLLMERLRVLEGQGCR